MPSSRIVIDGAVHSFDASRQRLVCLTDKHIDGGCDSDSDVCDNNNNDTPRALTMSRPRTEVSLIGGANW